MQLKQNQIIPTVGYTREKVNYWSENAVITIYDMSGHTRYRNLWHHYYPVAMGIIFVIDASDPGRMSVAKEELRGVLEHDDLPSQIPLLIFANKMDAEHAEKSEDIKVALMLEETALQYQHEIQLLETNGLRGDGVSKGMDWIAGQMRKQALDRGAKEALANTMIVHQV